MDENKKKVIISLGIAVLIIGIFGGYMIKKNEERPKGPEAIKDRIISFLDKKYGKEFVAMSLVDNDWQNINDELWVYPKGGDKDKDCFAAFGQVEDGKYTIYDTYVCQLISGEYEDRVKKITEEFFPQCKVEIGFTGDVFPNEFGINTKLQDIIDSGVKYNPTVRIMVAPTLGSVETFNKETDLFVKDMVDNKLKGSLVIFYLKENNLNLKFEDMESNTCEKTRNITIKQDFSIKNYN